MTVSGRRGDTRQRLGASGEAAAVSVLEAAGLTIVERRFRVRSGEIDVVAEDGGIVVFVEVKTRSGGSFGAPGEAVDRRKQSRLARTALAFLQRRGWLGRRCRFDVVEVRLTDGGRFEVHHLVDAFRLTPSG